jgi:hypothetical protein
VEQPFETWRTIVALLRRSDRIYDREAAAWLEQKLDQAPADQYAVTLTLSDAVYLRSVYHAGLALGLTLLPVER